jgi:uncharacterized phage protein (TIGR02218 family)
MSLQTHLETGATTIARTWALTRRDGLVMGFTDHDRDLVFDGIAYLAGGGLTARALEQSTGLAVDNSEAVGALTSSGLSDTDILAGLYDGATLVISEVNWANTAEVRVIFRGTIGEVSRAGVAFRAELRGLTEPLGQSRGRVFQPACSAVLGDSACKFETTAPGYFVDLVVDQHESGRIFTFASQPGFEDRWFEAGRCTILTGPAKGQIGVIKKDRETGAKRVIELWQGLSRPLTAGDTARFEAGCDKRAETCRLKFANFDNFRGFPHIPGEDWLMAYPKNSDTNDGGPLRTAVKSV